MQLLPKRWRGPREPNAFTEPPAGGRPRLWTCGAARARGAGWSAAGAGVRRCGGWASSRCAGLVCLAEHEATRSLHAPQAQATQAGWLEGDMRAVLGANRAARYWWLCLLAAGGAVGAAAAPAVPRGNDACGVSDANLLFLRQRICSSLTQSHTAWCGDSWKNVSTAVAHEDWPSQATYMHAMVAALGSPATCLNTSYARDTVAWLENDMANQTLSGSLM